MSKPKKKGLKKVREIAQREIEEEDTELVGALGVGRHGRPPRVPRRRAQSLFRSRGRRGGTQRARTLGARHEAVVHTEPPLSRGQALSPPPLRAPPLRVEVERGGVTELSGWGPGPGLELIIILILLGIKTRPAKYGN